MQLCILHNIIWPHEINLALHMNINHAKIYIILHISVLCHYWKICPFHNYVATSSRGPVKKKKSLHVNTSLNYHYEESPTQQPPLKLSTRRKKCQPYHDQPCKISKASQPQNDPGNQTMHHHLLIHSFFMFKHSYESFKM